jgi:ASPIC/UnbV protein/VCBS repeat protein
VLLEFVLNEEGDISDASRWPDMSNSSMGGKERNVLLLQTASGFVPHSEQAGVDSVRDSRGVAIADFDHDGRMDLVVSNVDASPQLYRNVSTSSGRWVQFRLTATAKTANRSAVGARIKVKTNIGEQIREIASANGFDAQSSLQAHFGIGKAERIEKVTVRWPDGTEQQVTNLAADRVYTWTQGAQPKAAGAPVSANAAPPAKKAALVFEPVATLAANGLPVTPAARPAGEFKQVAGTAGIKARHHPPQFDQRLSHIMEMVAAGAAGAAIGDYNRDGLLDVFINDSRNGTKNFLYRNNGDGTFTDVAAQAGVGDLNNGAEVSTGGLFFDYDGDGWEDLLITRFGKQMMFHNRRDGTFKDVSKRAGFNTLANVLSAVAFDYDRDGDLDLYLGSYFQDVNMFQLDRHNVMHDSWEASRNGGSNIFYRNNGDGTFTDITAAARVQDTGWTMAVGHTDIDGDGWQDLYVANDFGQDRVFRNARNGKFEDYTERAIGTDTKKGMNAEAGDYDNDGDMDFYITNVTEEFLHECNMLWQNNGHGQFTDVAQEMNVCDTGWGWAGKFFDYDNDMDLDLYVANGFFGSGGSGDYLDDLLPALWDNAEKEDPSDARLWPQIRGKGIANAEANVFFVSQNGKSFSRAEGSGLEVAKNSRAILLADFNNDGRVDLFVTNNDDEAQLFMNEKRTPNHWLQIELAGRPPNTRAIGARLQAHAGGIVQTREVNAGNGFGGGSMVRQHFGLGQNTSVERLVVRWPDGSEQTVSQVPADRLVRIQQGTPQFEVITGAQR